MATAFHKSENPDVFQTVERQITETFDNLIGHIKTRKNELLEELRKLKLAFQEKIRSQEQTLKDLENIRIQLQDISQKENTTNILQSTLSPIEKQISDLNTMLIQPPNLHFSFQTQIINELLGNLGKLDFERRTDLEGKYKARHLIEMQGVQHIHIDDTHLYLVNSSKIDKYDATNWQLMQTHHYTCKLCAINAIATSKNHFYFASIANKYNQHEITKLTKNTFEIVKAQQVTGGSNSRSCEFTSIALASRNELFVVDRDNSRICVFDSNLFYRREFGTETLKYPNMILIKEDRVFVKDNTKELHLFNKQGDHLRNLPEYGDVSYISCFCFDTADNMIFSHKNSVRIISPKGELLLSIGRETKGSEDVKGCGPVAFFPDDIIVGCRDIDCIKIF